MYHKVVKVQVPASIGNFAVGSDILGAAIDIISDEIILRYNPNIEGVHITKIVGDNKKLSKAIDQNTAGTAAVKLLQHLNQQHIGIELEIYKKLGVSTGFGSSAASAVGAVFALNKLLKQPLEVRDLLHFATLGEQVASGGYHLKNTAPALLGTIQLVTAMEPLTVQRIAVPNGLYLALVYPQIEMPSESYVALQDTMINLDKHIEQSKYLAGFIMGMERCNIPLIQASFKNVITEPQKSQHIPHFDEIKSVAIQSGALGCSIAGDGPGIFALCPNSFIAENCQKNMVQILENQKIPHKSWLTQIRKEGVSLC